MRRGAIRGGLTFLVMVLAACASPRSAPAVFATAVPTSSSTPDPCSEDNIRNTITLVNDHTRQFDDFSVLASNIIQPQLVMVIPPMQEIRRAAEDQVVPACMTELKRRQLQYMNAALDALLAFQANTDVQKLATAIRQSQAYHEQYALELARLLGVTLTAPAPDVRETATP